ncbi:MAG: PKD domain-containing protein, partial [Candidatus Sericytochromatia bacterium]
VASIWYYYEKKLEGSPSLHSLYDNQDSLWFDNPKGYKFASTLQKIYGDNMDAPNSMVLKASNLQDDLSKKYTTLSWKAFALSMLVTGEPQMVGVTRFDVNGNVAGGHALVAYKIDYSNGKLYVVDPNFESQFNEDRYIEFDGSRLLPYKSSEKVGGTGRTYTLISYWAKSSFIDYYGIAEQYNKLANNTIGNEYFPEVFYYYYDSEGRKQTLTDDMSSSTEKLKISAIAKPKSGLNQNATLTVIRGKDTLNNEEIEPEITLKSGDNLIGIYVQATNPSSNSLEWTDFKYVNIKYADLSIQPSVTNGVPNQEYTWKLQSGLPANTVYEWTFGDSSDESVIGALPVSHKYENEGTYTITVTAKDPKNNKEIGSASATAEIKNTTVSKYPKVTAAFKADVYTDPFIESSGGYNIPMLGASNYRGDTIMGPLTWSGDNFSTVYQNTDSSITRIEGLAMTTTIKGSIDFATNTLKNIYVNNTTTMDGKVSSVTGFSAKDVPLQLNGTYYEADIAGEEVEKYITSIDVGYKSVNWSNARLQIYFKEK